MSGERKRLYIETVGCQMNVLDSEMVVAALRKEGYELTRDPDQADALFFNTCSVREHAEEKTYSSLGRFRMLKERRPEKLIGVLGCMAQKDQMQVFERVPFVDLVVGPGQLHRIPELLTAAASGAGRQLAVSLDRKAGSQESIRRSHETFDPLRDPEMRPTPFQAYLRIQIGCDKFCTYCVVPHTRGPEQGRPPPQILDEARLLAEQGCLEITLLGQTVNSYRFHDGTKLWRMADLLEHLHLIDGLRRIKFVTNYPKDMTGELLDTIARLPKVSPYLHVPAQSGSDRVLQRMKRGYTVSDYRAMMERIAERLPQASISSDFIVGFSGETDEDFQLTMDLVEQCQFKNSFIFKYSLRPGTKAAELLPDDVPAEVKSARNHALLELQDSISLRQQQQWIGRTVEVLVEGPSKHAMKRGMLGDLTQMTGRTHDDRIVVWDGNLRQAGQFLPVRIVDATAFTLLGTVVTQQVVGIGSPRMPDGATGDPHPLPLA